MFRRAHDQSDAGRAWAVLVTKQAAESTAFRGIRSNQPLTPLTMWNETPRMVTGEHKASDSGGSAKETRTGLVV
jgi:hypothetical protein